MGLISGINIDGNLIGAALNGIGELAKDIRSAITGDISPEKKADIQTKLLEIENQQLMAQIEVNKIEATNKSTFVSGWRPAVGWSCTIGLFYSFIVQPLGVWLSGVMEWKAAPPILDMGVLFQLLVGLLGLATLRTFEKAKEVAAK